jgi:hypothetical protein
MQKIHNSTLVVTLSTKSPDETVSGTVDAYGTVGVYSVYYEGGRMPATISAALFGPAAGHFSIQNAGTIIANGTGELGFGIVLGSSGTVGNNGTIIAGTAMNAAPGTIIGEVNGVDLYGGGTIYNYGFINAGDSAIYLYHGGVVYNSGTVATDRNGIFAGAGTTDVYNYAAGRIIGPLSKGGAVLLGAGSVTNAGVVEGYYGVRLSGAGSVTNTGTISGGKAAVYLKAGGNVTNRGTISAGNYGVDLLLGGTAENTGSIDGGSAGIYVFSGPESLRNDVGGRVTGYEDGMLLNRTSGSLYNAGYVHGFTGIYGGGTIIDRGTVSGIRTGIALFSGTLLNSGDISGGVSGVVVQNGGTIIDSGTILGGTGYAVEFQTSLVGNLVLQPGAKIGGTVDLNGGVLELGARSKRAGTVALGVGFKNIGTIVVDKHAVWDFAGAAIIGPAATIVNDGTIGPAGSGVFTIEGMLGGKGVVKLGKKPLSLDGGVAVGQTIGFAGTGEVLNLGDASGFDGIVNNFAPGETIDVTGVSASAIEETTFSAGVLTLTAADTAYTITFASAGSFGNATLVAFADGTGTGITLSGQAKMGFVAPVGVAPRWAADFSGRNVSAASRLPVSGHFTICNTGHWVGQDILVKGERSLTPLVTFQA